MTVPAVETAVLHFGPFVLDAANARLTQDGRPLELAPKDFDVLCFLALRPGRLVTKDDLLDAVWQHRFVSESVLKTVISRLRGVLGDAAREPRYIETATRRGYRFIAEVQSAQPPLSAATVSVPPAVTATAEAQAESASSLLIGRDEALASLQRQLADVVAGKTRVVLVAGEAGIGKSSLIEAFMAEARRSNAVRSALGQCVEHAGEVEPYLPVLEALSALCRGEDEAATIALLRQVAPTWLVQLPWYLTAADRQQLQQEVAGATQGRMLRELGELLDRMTVQQPLLLAIEDLHWSDPATVQLIGFLARRRGGARMLLLGTLRAADVIVSEHPLRQLRLELRQHGLCEEIELELFSERDAGRYLAGRLGAASWPDALIRELHDHTAGLPLFLAAVIDELQATGGTVPDLAEQALRLRRVPRSIFDLIEQQHGRLPEATRRWLEAASVAGVEFLHAPLADALQIDADELQEVFDALARRGSCLREAGSAALPDGRIAVRYAFVHAVHRHVLYERIGAATRVRLHRRLAAALLAAHAEQTESIAAEVAVHFEKGADPPHAVEHLAIAAHVALGRFAAPDAAAIAQRALGLLASVPDRTPLRDVETALHVTVGVAMAEMKGVVSAESRHAFARTVDLMDGLQASPARVPAMHGIWWSTLVHGDMARARSMAAETLALADARDDHLLRFAGHSAMGITLVHIGEMPAAETHLLAALERHRSTDRALAPALFSFEPAVQLESYLAMCLWTQGRPTAAGARSRSALARAERLQHPMTLVLALSFVATLQGLASEHIAQAATADHALALIEAHTLPRAAGAFIWMRGSAQAALGDIDGGLWRMSQGRRLQEEHGLRYGLTRWFQHHAGVCLRAGRLELAATSVREGLELAAAMGEHAVAAELHALDAELLFARGLPAEAFAAWQRAIEVAQHQGTLHAEIAAAFAKRARQPSEGKGRDAALADALARWTDPLEPPTVAAARAALREG
ncbi:MAG: AAA family ATPase [Caldimonas sp.]